jgi:hypothetical protein
VDPGVPSIGRSLATETFKVLAGVSLAVATLGIGGIWSWISFSLGRWPWLLQRYVLLFPLILAITLLTLRRWAPARKHLAVAFAAGAACGLVASILSRFIASAFDLEQREILLNTLQTARIADFVLVESLFALVLTVGWLFGATASVLTVLADRLESRLRRSDLPRS